MSVAIVGGGLMGLSLAYFLSKEGVAVDVFEAGPALGGLAGSMRLPDGTSVDRFYHTILSSDSHVTGLCAELGLAEALRFRQTHMGFYYRDQIYPMNNIAEFFRFPPLGWIDRFRLGLTIVYAQFVRDWKRLEGIPVEKWLSTWSGRRTLEHIWRPMLKAKFDGGFEQTPATYIWSRLVRMKSTRSGPSQKEEAGHLTGGYASLVEAMADRVRAAGGTIHLSARVEQVTMDRGRATGIQVAGERLPFEKIVVTLPLPAFRSLIPDVDAGYQDLLGKTSYLGIVCPLMVLDRPLSGYWTLNITDDGIPFTGIIETTTYIDPQYVGGHHLVYLPKYTLPGSAWQSMSDEEIRHRWLGHVAAMFPDFDAQRVRAFSVQREAYVEPLHPLNGLSHIPPFESPVAGLYLATTAQIYPALTNAESVTRHARELAPILSNVGGRRT
jgi:protoporphyrinogen oxidase